jgi:hypothetical protein
MKQFIIILLATFAVADMYAQMPQGGGFGGRGGQGGGRRGAPPTEGRDFNRPDTNEKLVLDFFPEIPRLTMEQRMEVSNIMSDEQKDIRKFESQKRELMKKEREEKPDEKKIEKNRKKALKIDEKIQKRIEKSNKKIKKKLSNEQYQTFIEKRNEFRFAVSKPSMMPDGRSAPGRGREGMPPPDRRPDFQR